MFEDRSSAGGGASRAAGCPVSSEELLLYIYEDCDPPTVQRLEAHLAGCIMCRAESASLRETLDIVDEAQLSMMAEAAAQRDTPGAWNNLASRLRPDAVSFGESPRRSTPWWLQVAAVLLVAGASFFAGTAWMSSGYGPWQGNPGQGRRAAGSVPTGDPGAQQSRDPEAALREFAAQTDGYLNRSRIVLLEIANADTGSDSSMLRASTRSLLTETRQARLVADRLTDQRLDEMLGRLEAILVEISSLSDWQDAATIQRVRDQVNQSGLLEQIEILTPPPTHLAQKRFGR